MARVPQDGGKTAALSLRISPDIRDQLRDAASKSGRSLAGEIQHRLQLSLSGEESRQVLAGVYSGFGGKHRFLAMRFLAQAFREIELQTGKDPLLDPDAAKFAACVAVRTIETLSGVMIMGDHNWHPWSTVRGDDAASDKALEQWQEAASVVRSVMLNQKED